MKYEDQLAAARYRAERDQARQELDRIKSDRSWHACADAGMLLSEEDRGAIRWVSEHGGLDAVKKEWNLRGNFKRQLEKAQEKVERQQRHIEFVQGKCHERLVRIAALNKTVAEMRPRLMPEGMEWLVEAWPRFDDGEPVRIGDEVVTHNVWQTSTVTSISLYDGGSSVYYRWCGKDNGASVSGECVKRPATKALDADGVEIREGETVWSTVGEFDGKRTVKSVHVDDYKLPYALFEDGRDPWSCMCCYLTHRATVIAADGRPLREGEHVYHVETGAELVVKWLPKPGEYQAVVVFALPTSPASHLTSFDPDQLTHERPVADTWERLEEDAGRNPFDYCKDVGHRLDTCENSEAYKARDLVRRCKALAGVSE